MKFFKQSGVYLVGRIVPAGVGLGGVALYTRLLDPATIGRFALILSTTLLVSAIAYTWLRVAALRVVSGSSDEDIPDLYFTILALFAGTSVVILPLLAFALHLYKPELTFLSLTLAAAALVATSWYDLNASLLQARLSAASWGMLNLGRAVGIISLSTIFIKLGWKVDALLAGFALGNCVTLFFARVWLPAMSGVFNGAMCRRCVRFGWPQSASAALLYAAPVGQRWIIDAGVGATALGIFTVAQDFGSLVLSSLIGSVSLAGIPLAFKAKDRADKAALTTQLNANARLIFAVAIPAAVGLCVLAGPISHWVFGSKFWGGASVIIGFVAIAAFAVNIRAFYFDQAFELTMRPRPQALISFVGTIVSIGGCALLVPRYAAVGAALSAVAASLISLTLSILFGARVLAMPIPVEDLVKTLLATLGMGIALAVFPRSPNVLILLFEISVAVVIYVGISAAARPALRRNLFALRSRALER